MANFRSFLLISDSSGVAWHNKNPSKLTGSPKNSKYLAWRLQSGDKKHWVLAYCFNWCLVGSYCGSPERRQRPLWHHKADHFQKCVLYPSNVVSFTFLNRCSLAGQWRTIVRKHWQGAIMKTRILHTQNTSNARRSIWNDQLAKQCS